MIPFSTSVLGEYGDLRSSAIVYGLNLLWLALIYWIQIAYLARHPHLATPAFTPIVARTSGVRLEWVVELGWVISDLVSPMLLEISTISSASRKVCAAARPPSTSNEKTDPA